jgi:hypothetical protein
VLLSTLEAADPSTVVAGASTQVDEEGKDEEEESRKSESPESAKARSEDASAASSDAAEGAVEDEGDDINNIAESRTFLAKVSHNSNAIYWLELADYDESQHAPFPLEVAGYPPQMHGPPGMQPSPGPYYQPSMGYAAQQHQSALKSRQQYFFQMQQQHQQQQQQYPPQAWSVQQPYSLSAGEAAAVAQGQGVDQNQHWAAMYYQPGVYPPPQQEGQPTMDGGMDPVVDGQQEEHYHTAAQDEEPEGKRQRIEQSGEL